MKIILSNNNYKRSINFHRVHREFQEKDQIMVRLWPERFKSRVAKKLHAHSLRPYKMLRNVGPNAYAINLPFHSGISSTFNVKNLVPYYTIVSPFANPFVDSQIQTSQHT